MVHSGGVQSLLGYTKELAQSISARDKTRINNSTSVHARTSVNSSDNSIRASAAAAAAAAHQIMTPSSRQQQTSTSPEISSKMSAAETEANLHPDWKSLLKE